MRDTDERSTPQKLFDELNNEFHFTWDVAANDANHKCVNYYTRESNALYKIWTGTCFMNPPYSELYEWVRKANYEAKRNVTTVAILPVDSSTRWFHDFIWDKKHHDWRNWIRVRFPDTRFAFGENKSGAKFATMIVVFVGRNELAK